VFSGITVTVPTYAVLEASPVDDGGPSYAEFRLPFSNFLLSEACSLFSSQVCRKKCAYK